jgi:hypothetical protein
LQLRKLIFLGGKLLMMTHWILHLLMDLDRVILHLKLFKSALLNNFKMKKFRSLIKLRSLAWNRDEYLQIKSGKNIKNYSKELISHLFMNKTLITIKNFGDYSYKTRILLLTLIKYQHQITKQLGKYSI